MENGTGQTNSVPLMEEFYSGRDGDKNCQGALQPTTAIIKTDVPSLALVPCKLPLILELNHYNH